MDIFEKQQRIDSIRGIVKARWFTIAILVILGLTLKVKYLTGEWAIGFEYLKMIAFSILAFGYNFAYWLFIRRPIEKIGERRLTIVSALQVIVDQLIYTLIFYFTGTVESVGFVLYFITILIASSLYRSRGIILTGALAVFLHNSLLIVEIKGLIPHITAYPGTIWFGNVFMTQGKMIGFTYYMAVAVIFSIILSGLFRKQIKALSDKSDTLTKQSRLLTSQTQELTQAKDQLQSAFTKSDIARKVATNAKEDLEKANLELRSKIDELEKFYKVTVGREVKMVELKLRIKELDETVKKLQDKLSKKHFA